MMPRDELPPGRALEPPDTDTARRMVDGLVDPDDAPPGYALAAALLLQLRPTDGHTAENPRTIRMMAAVVAISDPAPRTRLRRLGRRR
jgi:hypothetical protein